MIPADLAGRDIYTYTPPATVGAGSASVGADAGAANPYSPSAPTTQQFQDWIVNSPEYKQGIESLTTGSQRAIDRENAMYALSSQIGSGGGGYTPQTVPQSFYDQIALAKEKAAHDAALASKALPEIMASRGMLSSGQTAFEAGEQDYNYQNVLKDLDLQKKAREEAVAQANASAASAASRAGANAAIQQQMKALQHQYDIEDITLGIPAERDKVLESVGTYYHDLWWDGSTYVGPVFNSGGRAASSSSSSAPAPQVSAPAPAPVVVAPPAPVVNPYSNAVGNAYIR